MTPTVRELRLACASSNSIGRFTEGAPDNVTSIVNVDDADQIADLVLWLPHDAKYIIDNWYRYVPPRKAMKSSVLDMLFEVRKQVVGGMGVFTVLNMFEPTNMMAGIFFEKEADAVTIKMFEET